MEQRNREIAELKRKLEEQQKQIAERDKTIAERDKKIAEREKKIAEDERKIAEGEKKIADLERQLALRRRNSTNSSKPPSSDGLAGPERKRGCRRRKTGKRRRPGGQKGHPGHSRPLVPPDRVNEVVDHFPDRCESCHQALPTDPKSRQIVGVPRLHQVTELPEIKAHIAEHRMHSVLCACGKITQAPLPAEVKGQFGPRLTAAMASMSMLCHIPRRPLQCLLDQVLGVPISLGSTQKAWEEASEAVAQPYRELEQALPKQHVLNCDETSSRTNKDRRWLWVFVAQSFAFFSVEMSRGREVLERLLGTGFAGILCNDRLGSYLSYLSMQAENKVNVLMQLCWAHLKRDLLGAQEVARTRKGKQFCRDALACEKRLFRLWHGFRHKTSRRGSRPLTRKQLIIKALPIEKKLFALAKQHLDSKDKQVRNLATALFEHSDKLFTFIHHKGVEPTNNTSERSLRTSVQRRKITFGHRSREGELAVSRLTTVQVTCRKQERNPLLYLTEAIQAYRAGKPAPSLLRPPA